jgi:hypothetical protein
VSCNSGDTLAAAGLAASSRVSLDVQHRRGSVAVVKSVGRVLRCHRLPWMVPSDARPRMQQQKFDWPAWSARAWRRSKRRGTRTWDC